MPIITLLIKEMFRMKPVWEFVCSTLLIGAAFGDQTVTTADGKSVILKDNGTWHYQNKPAAQKEQPAAALPQGSLFEVVKNSAAYDFRTVKWGMSKKDVLAAENAKPVKNDAAGIEYEMLLFGYQCVVKYIFTGDKLTGAQLRIRQEHFDPELFYQDYENLKQRLKPVFGETLGDKCDWNNDIYRSDRSKWGFAVSLGFLVCRTQWETPRTHITLTISGSNHQITTVMEYTSRVN